MGTETLDRTQLNRILDAGRAIVSELDRSALLARLLDDARELAGARYAALGVLDEQKQELEQFIFAGIDEDTRRRIGDLPRGYGILGELIRQPTPLRLARIGDHPRSYGFPPNHPPMTSFLGVPVMIRGEVYGNLYLTDKEGADEFDDADEALLTLFAEWAAIAIDNSRNYEHAERGRAELERAFLGLQTTASFSRELAGESDPAHAFELTTKRARALLDARSAIVLVRDADEFVVVECAGELEAAVRGRRLPIDNSPLASVLDRGASERISGPFDAWFAEAGIEDDQAIAAPLRLPGPTDGVICVFGRLGDGGEFGSDDVLVLDSFASAATSAIGASSTLEREMRERSIASSEAERSRWARELHDETLQELGALKVIAEGSLQAGDAARQAEALRQVAGQIEQVIEGVEGMITELRPSALDQLGAEAAIDVLIDRFRERTDLEIEADLDLAWEHDRAETRLEPDLEATAYRAVQEGLNNVIKHAAATRARIAVTEIGDTVSVTIEDDGSGLAEGNGKRSGFGLLGIRERVSLVGGEVIIGPGDTGGTRLRVVLPARRRA